MQHHVSPLLLLRLKGLEVSSTMAGLFVATGLAALWRAQGKAL